jgi:Ca2+-binding RTX toxin-like protein
MIKGRTPLLTGLFFIILAAAPASASALCNGLTATISGTSSGETIPGTAGDDVIEAGGGDDTVNGGGGNDTICGDAGDDTINGEGGNDHLEGGANTATGDTVTFLGSNGITASLMTGVATVFSPAESNTMTGFENLNGSNTFDSLTGDNGPNVIDGLDAADNLTGLGGDDELTDTGSSATDQDEVHYEGAPGPDGIVANLGTGTVDGTAAGAGTDTVSGVTGIEGSSFDDTLIGDANNNQFVGNAGDDVIQPLAGADFVTGVFGSDTVSYATETGPIVSADLSSGSPGNVTAPAGNDQVFGVEGFIGSPQNDNVTGGTEDNTFDGRGGDDQLNGAGGSNTASFAGLSQAVIANLLTGSATGQGSDTLTNMANLTGSTVGDTLIGDANANLLDGAGGVDTVSFASLAGPLGVNVNLSTGSAAGDGSDTLAAIENVTGSPQSDVLFGDGNPNVLDGLAGNDNLDGQGSPDSLLLGPGNDIVGAADGEVDSIDCTGGGPDSGTVDGPAPAETYTACDTDGDSVVDFLDACPTTSGTGPNGCVATSVTPPPTPTTPATPTTPTTSKRKCKKKKKHRAAAAKKCKKHKKK